MLHKGVFVAFALVAAPLYGQMAEKSIPLTREALDEAKRLCEVNAKNDKVPYVLLTGLLEQNRFEGGEVPQWFPPNYRGHFVKTNFYPPRQKVVVHALSSETLDVKELHMLVGEPYALCVKSDEYRQGKPHFILPHLSGVYRLLPNADK